MNAGEIPSCCGGGDFFGHESYCDGGRVRWEKAIAAVVQAARDMREHMVSAHPQLVCASCALRLKGLSEALGALDPT